MGISTNFYTIYGVYIPWSKEFANYDDENEEDGICEVDRDADLSILCDYMNGSYMIFGKILYDSGDLRWDSAEDSFRVIDVDRLEEYKEKAIEEFKKRIDSKFNNIIEGPWKLMTLAHYS